MIFTTGKVLKTFGAQLAPNLVHLSHFPHIHTRRTADMIVYAHRLPADPPTPLIALLWTQAGSGSLNQTFGWGCESGDACGSGAFRRSAMRAALRAGPCAQSNFCVFQGARALWRPLRSRCAAALRPQNGRKTGPQRAPTPGGCGVTVPGRCGVGQTRKRVCN